VRGGCDTTAKARHSKLREFPRIGGGISKLIHTFTLPHDDRFSIRVRFGKRFTFVSIETRMFRVKSLRAIFA
jgi:hypothetical protein